VVAGRRARGQRACVHRRLGSAGIAHVLACKLDRACANVRFTDRCLVLAFVGAKGFQLARRFQGKRMCS
jgi:hypothetical protein